MCSPLQGCGVKECRHRNSRILAIVVGDRDELRTRGGLAEVPLVIKTPLRLKSMRKKTTNGNRRGDDDDHDDDDAYEKRRVKGEQGALGLVRGRCRGNGVSNEGEGGGVVAARRGGWR